MSDLLEVKNLSVSFRTPQGELEAVRDVSLSLHPGEVLAIVGESGCGKSVLCRSIMKLLPRNAWIKGGTILADGAEITRYSQRDMERLRGRLFSMVLQDPMTALNPAMTIGAQIEEAVGVHQKTTRNARRDRMRELLTLVGLRETDAGRFPHHLPAGRDSALFWPDSSSVMWTCLSLTRPQALLTSTARALSMMPSAISPETKRLSSWPTGSRRLPSVTGGFG